jgi:hypothetical protein
MCLSLGAEYNIYDSESAVKEELIVKCERYKNAIDTKMLYYMTTAYINSGLAVGLPTDATAAIKYHSGSNFGAVLVTTPPIKHDGYYYESPFKGWFQDNVKAIMSSPRADEIKKYGLFVVTGTYMTTKCSLVAWTEPSKDVFLGFYAGPSGLGEVGPHVKWYDTGSSSGWNKHESTVSLNGMPLSLVIF